MSALMTLRRCRGPLGGSSASDKPKLHITKRKKKSLILQCVIFKVAKGAYELIIMGYFRGDKITKQRDAIRGDN